MRAITDNFGSEVQIVELPSPRPAVFDLHPTARKLLLISRPAEGKRLSWPEHTQWVTNLLSSCLHGTEKVWSLLLVL